MDFIFVPGYRPQARFPKLEDETGFILRLFGTLVQLAPSDYIERRAWIDLG
ncbi:hypothetical protein [Pseudomonas putida]|uniref:hypothetical protein n=1 Tax=Pseudomonas putida TaxID=303 RepID=UPI001374773A|nr:hypothetical protein [Pseudomonas putida]